MGYELHLRIFKVEMILPLKAMVNMVRLNMMLLPGAEAHDVVES
jgi:hypothetical protein